jgi:hypothetical protein
MEYLIVEEDERVRIKSPPPSPILTAANLQAWLRRQRDSPPASPAPDLPGTVVQDVADSDNCPEALGTCMHRRKSLHSCKPHVPPIQIDLVPDK